MKKKQNHLSDAEMTFWEHLDAFRKVIFRCLLAWGLSSSIAFFFKKQLFGIVFAPSRSDFIIYKLLCNTAKITGWNSLCLNDFEALFINTQLASQFMVHMSMSLLIGAIIVTPYFIFQLYNFVSPALYKNEKRHSFTFVLYSFFLFFSGVLLNYFVVFPFSFRFLSSYQVDATVVNQISLTSYISTLTTLSLLMGIIFEIPIVFYFLAKLNLINAEILKEYRKYAFIIICIIAAVITPTADIFTLLLVAIPIMLLYELSIKVVQTTSKRSPQDKQ